MSKIPQLVLEKKAKDGKDYKNTEIASALGISEAMVSRFLRDKVNVGSARFDTMLAWSNWLDCDPRNLAEQVDTVTGL